MRRNSTNPLKRHRGQTAYKPEKIFDDVDDEGGRIEKGDTTGVEAGLAALMESVKHIGDAIDGDAEAARKIQKACSTASVKSESYSGMVDDDVSDPGDDVDVSLSEISKSGLPKTVESYSGVFDGDSGGDRDDRLTDSEDGGTGRRLSDDRN